MSYWPVQPEGKDLVLRGHPEVGWSEGPCGSCRPTRTAAQTARPVRSQPWVAGRRRSAVSPSAESTRVPPPLAPTGTAEPGSAGIAPPAAATSDRIRAPCRRGVARLAWIQQNYLRTDTITNANARLVDAHAALPLTKALGSTELASADGLRFVVPVRSVHAAANPKYFGRGKGVTYINYTSAAASASSASSYPAPCAADEQACPELAQHTVVKARIRQLQAEDVLPVDAAPDRLGRLSVWQAFRELQDCDQRQAPGRLGTRRGPRGRSPRARAQSIRDAATFGLLPSARSAATLRDRKPCLGSRIRQQDRTSAEPDMTLPHAATRAFPARRHYLEPWRGEWVVARCSGAQAPAWRALRTRRLVSRRIGACGPGTGPPPGHLACRPKLSVPAPAASQQQPAAGRASVARPDAR
jgi:hypothetical protein